MLLNANIFPDMKITKMDNRGVTFVCANATAGGKEGFTTYTLKLRDPQTAKDFMSTVEAHKGTATIRNTVDNTCMYLPLRSLLSLFVDNKARK